MSRHHRRRSWSSMFSFDGIRSMSRTEGLQGILPDDDGAPRSQTSLSHHFGSKKRRDTWNDLPSMKAPKVRFQVSNNKKDSLKRSATDPVLSGIPYHEHQDASPEPASKSRSRRSTWLSSSKFSLKERIRQASMSASHEFDRVGLKKPVKALGKLTTGLKSRYAYEKDKEFKGDSLNDQDRIQHVQDHLQRMHDSIQRDVVLRSLTDEGETQDVSDLGHVEGKAISESKDGPQVTKYEEGRGLLKGIDLEAGDCPKHDHGRHHPFGSLSGFSGSAEGRFNLQTPYQLLRSSKSTFLGSKQSLFNNMDTTQDKTAGGMVDPQMATREASLSTPSFSCDPMRQPPPSRTLPIASGPTPSTSAIQTSITQPCIYSFPDGKIVEGDLFRHPRIRSGVNPLACHPQVTSFAQKSTEPSVDPPTDKSFASPPVPRIQIGDDEGFDSDLHDAIIYSASSGNLNTYARQTPSPARTLYNSPRSTMEKHSTSEADMTPTRASSSRKEPPKDTSGLTRSITGLHIRENVSGLFQKATGGYKQLPEKQVQGFEKVGVAGRLRDIDPGAMEMPATPDKRSLFARLGSSKKKEDEPPIKMTPMKTTSTSAALNTPPTPSVGRE